MASVSVHPTQNGKWRVMWRDKMKKQCQRTFDKKGDAKAYAAQLATEINTGTYIDPKLAKATVGEQYVYWQSHRRASRGRKNLEASVATNHLVPAWGKVPLEAVDFDAVQAWVNDLGTRMSVDHVRSCFRLLHGTLQSAVRSKKIPSNPADGVALPKATRKVLGWEDVLNAAEVAAVADAADERWSAFIFCSAWLGWRLSEGLGIRRRDVNLLRNEVTVGRVVIEEVNGKCEAREGGKTDAAARPVPLPATVAKVLEAHMRDFVTDPSPDAFLFVQENGNPPSRSNLLRRVLYPAMARGGVVPPAHVRQLDTRGTQVRWYDRDGAAKSKLFKTEEEARTFAATVGGGREVDFRQLRHTAASLMIDHGLDVIDVSQRLGHARPSITMDVYSHLFQSKKDRNTEALEAAIQTAAGR